MPILPAEFLVFSGSASDYIFYWMVHRLLFDCAFERGKGVVRRKHSNPLITTSRSSYLLLTFHPQFSNPRKPTLLVHLTVHHYRPQLREKYQPDPSRNRDE